MAIRKPQKNKSHRPESGPEADREAVSSWPYPIQERALQVQTDGSIRIPARFARMFAPEGECFTAVLFSDGHIEMEPPGGRVGPLKSEPGSRFYASDEEFLDSLRSRIRD